MRRAPLKMSKPSAMRRLFTMIAVSRSDRTENNKEEERSACHRGSLIFSAVNRLHNDHYSLSKWRTLVCHRFEYYARARLLPKWPLSSFSFSVCSFSSFSSFFLFSLTSTSQLRPDSLPDVPGNYFDFNKDGRALISVPLPDVRIEPQDVHSRVSGIGKAPFIFPFHFPRDWKRARSDS